MLRPYAAIALLCGGLAAGPGAAQSLFDGKTLAGWRQCNGTAKFAVEEGGVIVGTTAAGSPNSFLCTEKEYGDFILEFEEKHDPELNSGVQIRSHRYERETEVLTENRGLVRRKHEAGRVYGYQVEIATAASGASGGIYDEARRGWIDLARNTALRDNEWNRYRVAASGDSIKTWINGVAVADLVDSVDLTGFIALQVHQYAGEKPRQVRWRNIRLEDMGRHEWKPLTNGTLAGWTKWGGGEWAVVDGAFRGINVPAARGFLIYDRTLADFTIRLDYRAVKGNSGVFFRMGEPAGGEPGSLGFEVEVDPARDAGGMQEPGKRGWLKHTEPKDQEMIYKPGDWNRMTISAHGRRIAVHVNGVRTFESKDDPGRLDGKLALQINPRDSLEVFYRGIEILTPAGR
jgi:hypothetical protein